KRPSAARCLARGRRPSNRGVQTGESARPRPIVAADRRQVQIRRRHAAQIRGQPMTEAFLCEGVRTPVGRYGGALSAVRPDDLLAHAIRAALAKAPSLDPEAIDDVFAGCANQAGEDNRNVARMAALLAGLPASVPGATINRLCGSGLDAVGTAARAVKSGEI